MTTIAPSRYTTGMVKEMTQSVESKNKRQVHLLEYRSELALRLLAIISFWTDLSRKIWKKLKITARSDRASGQGMAVPPGGVNGYDTNIYPGHCRLPVIAGKFRLFLYTCTHHRVPRYRWVVLSVVRRSCWSILSVVRHSRWSASLSSFCTSTICRYLFFYERP